MSAHLDLPRWTTKHKVPTDFVCQPCFASNFWVSRERRLQRCIAIGNVPRPGSAPTPKIHRKLTCFLWSGLLKPGKCVACEQHAWIEWFVPGVFAITGMLSLHRHYSCPAFVFSIGFQLGAHSPLPIFVGVQFWCIVQRLGQCLSFFVKWFSVINAWWE